MSVPGEGEMAVDERIPKFRGRRHCGGRPGAPASRHQDESHESSYPLSHHHLRKITTEMSLPYPASGSSKKRKLSAAESRDKGVGSSGTDPGDLDGPQPAPAHRGHPQG